MSRTRYEPVPQRDETIILESIHGSPHYNYNSGLANSVASSRYEPSIAGGPPAPPSIPNSPPPSFHTHSSPGTPRPTPSTTTYASHHSHNESSAPSYAELWGVAPSTFGGDTTNTNTIGTSNDALATITGLKQRIEWLEESIGRLLMEKDQNGNRNGNGSGSDNGSGVEGRKERDNCCVTFTDASPDLERALTAGKGTNCCVTFRSKSDGRQKNKGPLLLCLILFMVCLTIVSVAEAGSKKQYPPGSNDGELNNANQS
ncbi:hypothetical protein ONS95_011462 [Cadophora gregata]|uniref:uncharacterized protein n=1 Tax=Cadophora gregata TaxID=51156 RepID=UPI0026DAAB84|nr:uncharacterized protein ONS95_011462 [Cadophora gregata]KAK0120049.1 hypothetical protein ONS95_011462 [Cadophora gregata]KAK0121082.1 hypothetical protein ONS96_011264 [Cadophora gregata f. sp. sojae]